MKRSTYDNLVSASVLDFPAPIFVGGVRLNNMRHAQTAESLVWVDNNLRNEICLHPKVAQHHNRQYGAS